MKPFRRRLPLWLLALFGAMAARTFSAENGDGVLELTRQPGAGDRFDRVDFTCWLPAPGRPVRAVIIHQHGCGNSSAATNPPVARDFHWQALARKHDCALVVPLYTVTGDCANWNDPDSGSERALFAALRDFSIRSGRPEIERAPWLLWGHSGGSSWAVQMILRHPGRVLAASLRGGCHPQFGDAGFRARFAAEASHLPLLFVWGRDEAVPASRHYVSWNPMQAMYRELRAHGGRVALAVDPRTEHHCGDSRLLILPYFDAVLIARTGSGEKSGAWVNVTSRAILPATPDHRDDPDRAWLPSESVARIWKEFSETGNVTALRPPSHVPRLQAALSDDARQVTLHWHIEPELDGGLRTVRIHRDQKVWQEIGVKAGAFLVTNRDSPPNGLHASSARDETVRAGASYRYAISFIDRGGAESALSPPVEIRVPAAAVTTGSGGLAPTR